MDGGANLPVLAGAHDFVPPKRYHWTTREIAALEQHYERLGPQGMLPHLSGRTVASIYQQAGKLGLKAPRGSLGKGIYQRWPSNPHIDEAIRRLYQSLPERGKVKAFAASIARPRSWVTQRAIALGVALPRFKEPEWTPAELELLEANAHKSPKLIGRLFASRGFKRTPTAISVKIKRVGACRIDPDHFTGRGLAELFGVDPTTVSGWIAKGWLKANRRGTERTEAQGGDQWWIHRKHVRDFVIDNVAAVDFRKVDKFWLVDLLTGKGEPA